MRRQQILTDVNITDAIFSVADKSPHAVAIIDGEAIISFRSLCHGVCVAAKRFRQAGWRAGDIVGISLSGRRSLHVLVSLALARMGITQVSLPADDPPRLIRLRIEELGVNGVVSDHMMITESRITTVVAEPKWMMDTPNANVADDLRVPGGDRLWIIAEGSGTTGKPKLIGISHALDEIHGNRLAPVFAFHRGERFLNLIGLRFLTGINWAMRCLREGGTIAFSPAGLNAEQLLRWIDLHHVTYMSCVPLHLHLLLRDIKTSSPRLPLLRILRCGGSALPVSTLNEVRNRISRNVYISYGLNEVSGISAATPDMLSQYPDTVGRPYDGVELEIVDDLDRTVPSGATGHVRVRGPGIQSTYFPAGAQDEAHVFRNGWCYPGDIVVRSQAGLIFIKGRTDDVMNFDGILVGPEEIESVLRQHPAVLEAAAFPLPSQEHQDIPAAAIVSSRPVDIDELARFCAERLGIRTPHAIFQFDEIPKNPAGKVLRRHLTELALARLQQKARP